MNILVFLSLQMFQHIAVKMAMEIDCLITCLPKSDSYTDGIWKSLNTSHAQPHTDAKYVL